MKALFASLASVLEARRTAARLLVAAVLMAPAAGLVALRTPMPAARSDAESVPMAERIDAAARMDGPVAAAWREKALERERLAMSAEFAQVFDIPLDLADAIHAAAQDAEIEPEIAFGLVRTESSFRRTAVSYAGAVGYTQLLPSTANWMVPGTSRADLFQRDTNLQIGFRYLRYLLDKYEGDVRLALTAYNRGPGTVDRLLRRGRNPENGYADRVLRG